MENLEERYKDICLKLWGEEQGAEIHEWIITNRPVAFQESLWRSWYLFGRWTKSICALKYCAVSPLLLRLDGVR